MDSGNFSEDRKSDTGTQTGLKSNVAGFLCYLVGWLTGIIFLAIENDPFVRFHAIQSIIVFGGLTVLSILLSCLMSIAVMIGLMSGFWYLFSMFNTILMLLSVVLWIVLMFKAYQGERFKLPLVGEIAEKYAK